MQTYEVNTPPTREEIEDACPSISASPAEVRAWLESYFIYRGMDLEHTKKFHWRGKDLYKISFHHMVEAFQKHCGLLHWEAYVLAFDVISIVENVAIRERGYFQFYVDEFWGRSWYEDLTRWSRRNANVTDLANSMISWIWFSFLHGVMFVLLLIVTLIVFSV